VAPGPDETLDSLGDGEVRLLQHRRGYRFSLDAVLLAHFAAQGLCAPGRRPVRSPSIVDLGTGCGVVALLLARRVPAARVAAVEVQPGLADLARRNCPLNGLDVRVVESDLRDVGSLPDPGTWHLATCNPPYFPRGRVRTGTDPERNAARQEVLCTVADAAAAAARLLRSDGMAAFVYPAERLATLFAALADAGLTPVRMRLVHPRDGAAAMLALVEAAPRSRRPLAVEAPLVVHAGGGFTPEVAAMLGRSAAGLSRSTAASDGRIPAG